MSNFYVGQLMCVAFNFAPKFWADCNGQILGIAQNQALFSLLGTTYGGNGVTTFGLPNLQGRTPIGANAQYPLGTAAGEASHSLVQNEIPQHNHMINAVSSVGTLAPPNNQVAAAPIYNKGGANTLMNPGVIGAAGNGQPHENRSPFTTLRWVIALNGIFPSRS